VQHLDALYTNTASLVYDVSGNLREAFEWAEKGKSQLLRHQLAWIGRGESDTSPQLANVAFDELHALLSRESAALAMFNLGDRHSSVFIIHPQELEPEYHKIDLTLDELKKLLPEHPSAVSAREKLFEALPQLSKKLLPPLREVVKHCSTLYLIPSSLLYTLPFAALTFDDGTYLIQHCALAYVPTATVLKWCYARRSTPLERSCLAVGAKDEDGVIAFAQQAQDIAALTWARQKLLPETTTAGQFLEEAQHFSVLHLACHGLLNPGASALQASYIKLADKLTTQSVFDSRLNAELVFLNACWSGSFQLRMREEVGGFWQAFLVAGATSLIATLFDVDPNKAQQLALNFYGEWLKGGVTKAEALRRTQCSMLDSGSKPHEWATHILIGDHR
jgi:CHAT domain-containing protein